IRNSSAKRESSSKITSKFLVIVSMAVLSPLSNLANASLTLSDFPVNRSLIFPYNTGIFATASAVKRLAKSPVPDLTNSWIANVTNTIALKGSVIFNSFGVWVEIQYLGCRFLIP
ncbi:MAG: hypothetical protein ACKPGT_21530, partial [Microcystis sp.]